MAAPLPENVFDDDNLDVDVDVDVDMQIDDNDDDDDDDDDDNDLDATPSVPRDDLNSSPSSSSTTDDDDHLLNPSRIPDPLLPNGFSPLQALPISSLEPPPPDGPETTNPEAKRQCTDGHHPRPFPSSSSSLEDSRRLFQRLWTDEDEIAILEGFHEFTARRGTAHHAHQHDTGPFYEQIRAALQLDFTKNQLVEKIRRLKKKYRNTLARMASSPGGHFAFRSPHDRATFELSRKIWSPALSSGSSRRPPDRNGDGEEDPRRRRGRRGSVESSEMINALNTETEAVLVEVKSVPALMAATSVDVKSVPVLDATPVDVKSVPLEVKSVPARITNANGFVASTYAGNPNVVEETVRSCLSPLLKDLLSCAVSGPSALGTTGGYATVKGLMPVGFMGNIPVVGERDVASEGKWRKQQILELEVYSKRLELVQEQVKVALEELRSSEGST